MQFKIPQNVQMEDRIVGPLTLKHMIILGIGGGFAYVLYVVLARSYYMEVWLPPIAIIVILTLLFAFVKIYNVSFAKFIILFIEHLFVPRKRKWQKASAEIQMQGYVPEKEPTKLNDSNKKDNENTKTLNKLNDISKVLDTYGTNK
ncbi:PrgI family protein [Patescibacteria group bacterium]|nr:PrgI family protein [Patescibacteria group bacterium]